MTNRRDALKALTLSPLSMIAATPQHRVAPEEKIISTLSAYMKYKCHPKLTSISVNDSSYIFRFTAYLKQQYLDEHSCIGYIGYPVEIDIEVIYERTERDQFIDFEKIDAALEKPVMMIQGEKIFTIAKLGVDNKEELS